MRPFVAFVVTFCATSIRATSIPQLKRWFSGCGQVLPEGQTPGSTTNVSITSSGITRSYNVFVPPTYNNTNRTSLILSYHGGLRNASQQQALDQLTDPIYNMDTIVVYPQGINVSWQGVPGDTANDIQFTSDIIDQVEATYCIDSAQIYATGKSDGAGLVNLLACDPRLSGRIAAFAPVSGAYYVADQGTTCNPSTVTILCSPSRTDIPLLAFHGGNDTTISYYGGARKGECLPTIPHFIQAWAARDDLAEWNTTVPVATDTVFYEFGQGELQGIVGLYYETNIGHDWPSTVPNADNQVKGHHVANYNATPIILNYFHAHPLCP